MMRLYPYKETKRKRKPNTLKQNLAGEYNFMLFRAEGSYLGGQYNRNIPPELQKAYADAHTAYKEIRRVLRLTQTRKDFMQMNLKNEGEIK